jgi:hypothetical protein
MNSNQTPILLLIFNRPDKVRELLVALEKVKPTKIYVSADGPRSHVPDDIEKCQAARELFKNLSWPCEIHTNFSAVNLGCSLGPVSGINWFFKHVEEGIILEDDCIPHSSFFGYASTLLSKYRDDTRVMHISGTSFLKTLNLPLSTPYYFSKIAHGWGWATWRRAWSNFDITMKDIPQLDKKLREEKTFLKSSHNTFWIKLFRHVSTVNASVWDTQWEYSILAVDGLCITPCTNMIQNVGFGTDATHTIEATSYMIPAEAFDLTTLQCAVPFEVNKDYDAKEIEAVFIRSRWSYIRSLLKKWYNFTH